MEEKAAVVAEPAAVDKKEEKTAVKEAAKAEKTAAAEAKKVRTTNRVG